MVNLYALTESPNRLILLKTNKVVTSVDGKKSENGMTSAYPNPAKDFVQINMDDVTGGAIYAISGEYIRTLSKENIQYNAGEVKINISDLKSGMYLIELKSDDAVKTVRFSKL